MVGAWPLDSPLPNSRRLEGQRMVGSSGYGRISAWLSISRRLLLLRGELTNERSVSCKGKAGSPLLVAAVPSMEPVPTSGTPILDKRTAGEVFLAWLVGLGRLMGTGGGGTGSLLPPVVQAVQTVQWGEGEVSKSGMT